MIDITVGTMEQARKSFFDTRTLSRATDRAAYSGLTRYGAWVRRAVRKLLKYKKGASSPGEPPYVHKPDSEHNLGGKFHGKSILREWIFYVVDRDKKSVVIGPAKSNQVFIQGSSATTGAVPGVLEHGGSVGIIEWQNPKSGKWSRADLRQHLTNKAMNWSRRIRLVSIAPRPFMSVAASKVDAGKAFAGTFKK